MKSAIFTFGRFNPPHKGHERMIHTLIEQSAIHNADIYIYSSIKHDNKKNLLTPEFKLEILGKCFPNITIELKSDIIDILKELDKEYNKIICVIGSDRSSLQDLFEKYNGKEYHFDEIEFVIVDRNDDRSSTKMREFVKNNDPNSFILNCPSKLNISDKVKIFNFLREKIQ